MSLRPPVLILLGFTLSAVIAHAQLRGHGGPVRALAIAPDASTAISGSFDGSAIRWSLARNVAEQVLRFHEGAVNAVVILKDGRVATAGEDRRIAVWNAGMSSPTLVLEGHQAPIAALAVSPDGSMLASAGWDHAVRLWSLNGDGGARVLDGHQQNVNGVAFAPDGRTLVSAAYDLTVRIWPLAGGAPSIVTLPTPLNSVAVAPDGEIVTGGADGKLYFLSPSGEIRDTVEAGETPIIAIALSPDGALIAAAGVRGAVAIVDRATRQVARTLVGRVFPGQSHAADRRHRSHDSALECGERRTHRRGGDGRE